jgi:hypothetical protein
LKLVLDSTCWYNTLGVDNADWNKLVGVYHYWDFRKNKNAVIIAWRPYLLEKGWFEVCMYENINRTNHPHEDRITLVRANIEIGWELKNWLGKYTLLIASEPLATQKNPIEYGTVGVVSAWFGGNQTAPHRMRLWLSNYNPSGHD